MPLQNRVTPFGDIVALEGRGTLMGNRGILHDAARRIVRPWQVRRWIACRTEFRGRRRAIMQPHTYTELFFLDEAAAFAAGHRPCAECRYADYRRFRTLWAQRRGVTAGADEIDRVLHADRVVARTKRTYLADVATLPDGAYIALNGTALLVWSGALHAWSALGYTKRIARPARGAVVVLTPRSAVEILQAGYLPAIHPSAEVDRRP